MSNKLSKEQLQNLAEDIRKLNPPVKPEPRAFTKKFCLVLHDLTINDMPCWKSRPCVRMGYQACDIIDRLTTEKDRYQKLHECELGVCKQHCDVVKELQVKLKAKDDLLIRAWDALSSLHCDEDVYEELEKMIKQALNDKIER